MAEGQDPTPFYIRTNAGQTFYVDTLEEALKQFASEDGYRLTLTSDSLEVVIRRSSKETDEQGIHSILGEAAYNATVIVRNRT